jgi:predicted chitinase
VRTEPKAAQHGRFTAGDLVGLLPEDSEVVVGEIRGPWGHITALTAGHMISPNSGDTFGGDDDLDAPWHSPDDSDTTRPVTPTGDYGWIYLHDQHAVTEPTAMGSVVIPPEPIPIKGGTLLGQLGEYLDYERSTPLPPVPSRQLLHLEVFAHESFKTFLDTSRTQAAQLPADQKTILTINPGAKLVPTAIPSNGTLSNHYRPLHDVQVTPDSPAAGRWVKVQPRIINSAVIPRDPVWIERSALASAAVGTPTWSRFPLQLAQAAEPSNGFLLTFTRAELDAFDADSHAVDDQGVHWWHVQYGASDGKPARGWVCEKNHPNTSWQSPWAWPGFEIVDATDIALTDAFLRNLVVTGSADWQEEHKFKTSVDTVNNTRLLRKLDQLVSKLPPSERRTSRNDDPSNRVTARAIQEVLKTPWLAQPLTHLILRYESEWGGNMTRWEAITPLMRNARENWECELQRIGKLQWWNDVKGKVDGLPGDPKVYHIHPIALVGNFRRPAALVCAHCDSDLTITSSLLKQIFSDIHPETAEGFAPELNTAFQKYEINTCHRIAHFFGQCAVECAGFTAFRENLRYTNGDYLWRTYTTALTRGLKRIHPDWSHTQIEEYSKTKLINNDPELGMVLFGDDAYPNADFRGRGLLHVTWKATYEKYKNCGGKDVLSDPTLMQRDRRVATDASAWYWSDKSINAEADDNNVEQVTRKINPALMDFDLRKSAAKKAFSLINKGGEPCKHNWESMLTREHGW